MRESAVDKAVRTLQAGVGLEAGTDEIGAAVAVLRKLPRGVPVAVVREAWRWVMRFPSLYYTVKRIPDEQLELTTAGLRSWKSPASTFMLTALSFDRSPAALHAANRAFFELDNLREPYAPSGRKRIEQVMRQSHHAAGVRAAFSKHAFHPRAVYPGEKGWNKKMKNIAHAGILRGVCECGGCHGDAWSFFRALVYDGGPESVAALRPLFKKSKTSPAHAKLLSDLFRFAKTPELVELYERFGLSVDVAEQASARRKRLRAARERSRS